MGKPSNTYFSRFLVKLGFHAIYFYALKIRLVMEALFHPLGTVVLISFVQNKQ